MMSKRNVSVALAVVATSAATFGAVALTNGFRSHSATARPAASVVRVQVHRHTTAAQPAAQPAAADPANLATNHASPTYLPTGAHAGASRSLAGGGWTQNFTLDGVANSDEMPADPSQWNGQGPAHPATTIQLTELPQTASALGPFDSDTYSQSQVTIHGVTATVVVPRNGYGVYRIDWVVGGVAYDLQCERLNTNGEGTSGVPTSELVKIAQSIG